MSVEKEVDPELEWMKWLAEEVHILRLHVATNRMGITPQQVAVDSLARVIYGLLKEVEELKAKLATIEAAARKAIGSLPLMDNDFDGSAVNDLQRLTVEGEGGG